MSLSMDLMSILYFISMFTFIVTQDLYEYNEKLRSLCDRPYIYAADRLANNTVRVYRGRYYWELKGMPGVTGSLVGPYELPYEYMGANTRNNSIVTLLGGTDRGKTVKFEDKVYWMWDERGKMKTTRSGLSHNRIPFGGFEAAIHDGNPNNPTLIGFKGIKTYYFSTLYRQWTIDNRPSGWLGGKYNESFPVDLSAAFSYPADDPKDGYIIYFFKRDKFCKRTRILKSGKDCDEWMDNKQLFGCNQNTETKTSEPIVPIRGGSPKLIDRAQPIIEETTPKSQAINTSVHFVTTIIAFVLLSINC